MPHAVARRARPPEAGNHEVVKAGMDIGRLVPYPAGVLDIWGGLRFGTTISTAAEMQPTASWILLRPDLFAADQSGTDQFNGYVGEKYSIRSNTLHCCGGLPVAKF